MDEALLLQMNDFDRHLELGLQRMLDPVVSAEPPARGVRRRVRTARPVLAVEPAGELVAEAIPVRDTPLQVAPRLLP